MREVLVHDGSEPLPELAGLDDHPLPEERLRLVGPQRARRGGREARDVGRALLLVEGVAWGLVEKGGN